MSKQREDERAPEAEAQPAAHAGEAETEEIPILASEVIADAEEALAQAGAPPTPEELAELRRKAAAHDELEQRLLRAAADYANSTKRLEREMQERSDHAIESFARELLLVADDITRAVAAAREHETPDAILEGLEIVEKHLYAVLERHGVTPIETLPGHEFDPDIHEAVSVTPTDDLEPNRVVHEVQRGFRIHARLLRPARVVVSAAPG